MVNYLTKLHIEVLIKMINIELNKDICIFNEIHLDIMIPTSELN